MIASEMIVRRRRGERVRVVVKPVSVRMRESLSERVGAAKSSIGENHDMPSRLCRARKRNWLFRRLHYTAETRWLTIMPWSSCSRLWQWNRYV